MKRSLLAALAAAILLPASVLAYTSPTWNLNGSYTIAFTCTSGCGGIYPHSMTIDTTSDTTGAVTGTGHYNPSPSTSWVLTGQVTGWDIVLDVDYDNSAYAVHMIGSINAQGGMSGTATGPGQTFTWATTTGSVGLYSPRCEYGSYTDAVRLPWDGFAPATGGVITTPVLDPTRDYFVEVSGTYFAGGIGTFDIQADAEYSQDAAQRAADAIWTDSVNTYEGLGESLLELFIDGAAVEWGTYSPTHRYTLDVTPTGSPLDISANIYDSYAPNNVGGLCVAVYEQFRFTGFFSPVDNLPTVNMARAGSAIPVKFSLNGVQGLDIFWTGYPKSHVINCESGADLDFIESTATAGGSSLTYDPVSDQYNYVWKTDKAWSGTCRELDVRLADGSYHYAQFKFR